jgi:predicted glycoside hydrolase/deacetylase ChbG (UPF0249 family)
MDDSERAVQLALEAGLEVGLHLNLSEPFDKPVSPLLKESQDKISAFLFKNRFRKMIYNPFLTRQFDYAFKSQYDEFIRIYGKVPSHIDGHHHFHLCANMVLGKMIPAGTLVRRNYTYFRADKAWPNRLYRKIMDACLMRNHVCTDYFFALLRIDQPDRLRAILALAAESSVELMSHPEEAEDFSMLMSDAFMLMIRDVKIGTHADIKDMRSRTH